MNGILVVDKPAGWTSQDVTARLRRACDTRRIGHGGTLDPMATGVLPVFVGRATRAVPFFEDAEKTYLAKLRLGLTTDTEDTTGTVLSSQEVSVTEEQFRAILPQFTGQIFQVPPMYSALKVEGRRLYDLGHRKIAFISSSSPGKSRSFPWNAPLFPGNRRKFGSTAPKGPTFAHFARTSAPPWAAGAAWPPSAGRRRDGSPSKTPSRWRPCWKGRKNTCCRWTLYLTISPRCL